MLEYLRDHIDALAAKQHLGDAAKYALPVLDLQDDLSAKAHAQALRALLDDEFRQAADSASHKRWRPSPNFPQASLAT